MQYQAIILAFRCPLASVCRGPPGQSHWNQSELVMGVVGLGPNQISTRAEPDAES